jgi:trk system potassium uptake protein TrkA
MKIIILGGGQVGGTLAEHLAHEQNDITVIDTNSDRLRDLQDRLDINTLLGHAAYPDVIRDAGGEDADMLVAVTGVDEINIVACHVAETLFQTPTKICRIRAPEMTSSRKLFDKGGFPIDVVINPGQLVTEHISRLLQYPGALQVVDFADGLVQLVAVRAVAGGPLVGQALRVIRKHMPGIDTRVAAIFRKHHPIAPEGDTVVEEGDEVFFIAAREHIRRVMAELRRGDSRYKRVFIAGGGKIGHRLARNIEESFNVKLIEQNYDRCRYLSESLSKTIVLHGEASDKSLLLNENIEDCDVFCALTNDDEANIMSSLLAKDLGARKVFTLIANPAYVDLMQGKEIDVALSPQQIAIGTLLTYVRKGDVAAVHSLRRGAAEAIELVAHGDQHTSKVVGKRLEEINLPDGVRTGAIVRDKRVLIAHRDLVVESDDHIILFFIDKSKIRTVEKLFQVGFTFF